MDTEEISALFNRFEDEFLKFDRVENPRSKRADLHAFLLLDELVPGNSDIVSSAEHDQIWLDVDQDELVAKATEAQLIDLVRCGVMYDDDVESLSMYV